MNIIDHYRKTAITILAVDSIPCSLVGNKMVLSASGKIESEPWKLPWAMPWIERELKQFVMDKPGVSGVSGVEKARIYNPEEPDQYVEVKIERYIDLTIGELLDKVADLYPEKEALIDYDNSRRYNYREFQKLCSKLSKGLLDIGVKKGDKTVIWSTNSPEFIISQFGASKIGSVWVPLSPYEKQTRMETLLNQADATTLIMKAGVKDTENIKILYEICPELKTCKPGNLCSKKLPKLKNVIMVGETDYPGTYRWSEIIDMGSKAVDSILTERFIELNYNDVIHMIYTSGTTGIPKGVLLSHSNIIENALAMAERMRLTPEDKMCVQSPLFHCFGCVACTITSITKGCSMVVIEKFQSRKTLMAIEKEKCTVASGVPTMFLKLINDNKKFKFNITSLRTGIIAGARCTPELASEISEVLGMNEFIISYGLTEATPCIVATQAADSILLKETTVGCAIPGVEISIVNHITNQPVKTGMTGEICARGYNVMKGYYKMPDETSKVIDEEGWLHTGDIGILHDNGYLEMVCRCKDIVIRGGENISPKEIEMHIASLEEVSEVYVVGMPDNVYGEEIIAFIKLKDGKIISEEDIKAYCKEKLSSNKIPKYIAFVEQFPLSSTGKVLKSSLQHMAKDINKAKDIKMELNKKVSKNNSEKERGRDGKSNKCRTSCSINS